MPVKLGKKDFSSLKAESFKLKGRYFIFLFVESQAPGVGFIVSRRHGGAVKRNRQKRWIRSFLGSQRGFLGLFEKIKLLIVALPHTASYKDKQDDFLKCLGKVKKRLPTC